MTVTPDPASDPSNPGSVSPHGGGFLSGHIFGIPTWVAGGVAGGLGYLGYKWWKGRSSPAGGGTITTSTTNAAAPPKNATTTVDLPGGVSYQGPPWGLEQVLGTQSVAATTPSGAVYDGPGGGLMQFIEAVTQPATTTPTSTVPPAGSVSTPTSSVPPAGSTSTPSTGIPATNPTSEPGYGAGIGALAAANPGLLSNTSPVPTSYDPYPATYNGVPINTNEGTTPSTPSSSGYGAGVGALAAANPGILSNTSSTPTSSDPYPAMYNGVPINVGA